MDQKMNNTRSLEDLFRSWFKVFAENTAKLFIRIGLRPNAITFLGLFGHIVSAYLVIKGYFTIAGVLLVVLAPMDFLDGTMARLIGVPSKFGALIDSVTDRYSEFIIFGGLLVYYMKTQNWLLCAVIYLAVMGSVMVSYIRARGEGLGFNMKVGALTRLGRYLILLPGLVFARPDISVWLIAILGNYTAIQRIVHVKRNSILSDHLNNVIDTERI